MSIRGQNMASYRFCRPDDMPRLVRAVNECYNPHFPGNPPLTLDGLQQEVRELSVWPSNCMIASDGEVPVAVSIATKRPREVLVLRVGVRPGHQRQGHGRHLLTSLSQKLAVLGPSRLIAEVPAGWESACSFLESCGYHPEASYTDFRLESPLQPLESAGALIPVSVEDLRDNGLLGAEADLRQDCAWQRQTPSLAERQDTISGLAVASPDRIEAFLLQSPCGPGKGTEIVRLGAQHAGQSGLFLTLLLRAACLPQALPLRIPQLSPTEAGFELLESLGFRPTRQTVRYATSAKPL